MSAFAVELRRETARVAPALGLTASLAFLLARLVPDVAGKPWQEDEAVAGLISARPSGELLHTVVLDRGGAPLHFVLAHTAFALHGSPQTLRWLSLVFALATIPLCYDLAWRVAGEFAGITAAALAATSQLLAVYGTFGRMYSLFAFASALSLDLFVRALDRPGRSTVAAAAAAAFILLLVHPFGVFVFAAEAVVAVLRWRVRALPFALAGVALAFPYLRLSGRYDPDAGMSAPEALLRALGGSAGGYGPGLIVFGIVATIGALSLARMHAAFAAGLILLPTAALAAASGDKLSPRHLIFLLPVWTTLLAAGIARLPLRTLVAVVAVAASALAPTAIADPRANVTEGTAAPADWLRARVAEGDALYPYSPVFLAALPEASVAHALPREPVALARALERAPETARTFVALPTGRTWRLLEVRGPFANVPHALAREIPHLHGLARAAALQLYATSTEGTSPQRSSSR
ncbi:MAG: hypothetical protein ACJ74D_04690 [Gaiellaceae bacterium]